MIGISHLLPYLFLLSLSQAISIPLSPMAPKCMVIYTVQPDENLKLDVTFPPLQDQTEDQFYQISLINTEDRSSVRQNIGKGVYRKELALQISIVYRLCFMISTSRAIPNVQIQYSAELKYNKIIEEVKIPQSLLKVEDLTKTYKYASDLMENIKIFRDIQTTRTKQEDQLFIESQQTTSSLILISFIELFIIIFAGIYQFWSIRRYLVSKGYL